MTWCVVFRELPNGISHENMLFVFFAVYRHNSHFSGQLVCSELQYSSFGRLLKKLRKINAVCLRPEKVDKSCTSNSPLLQNCKMVLSFR